MAPSGNLIIVSGPSGSGKSVLAASVLKMVPGLTFSVSHTTRAPRGNERDGVEYYFVDKTRFEELIQKGEFLEWAEVYGNYYGTRRSFIDERLARGDDVLVDVDVQGARTIRQRRPEAISIFIMPPSYQVLRERLERRRLDKEYVIEQRLRIACEEIKHYRDYDFLIVNEDLEDSIDKLRAIIIGSRCRMRSRADHAKSIMATFGGMDGKDS
ncbi:MAG: guanylate kinase [Acidobacteria bacterium]|nr:MAG: guanylate kinase [Acidobacteriota bacterium]